MQNKISYLLVAFICGGIFMSCDPTPAPIPPIKFLNVTFDRTHTHFSMNGTMTQPVDSNHAKLISDQIDITFIYADTIMCTPGFMDPITRSQTWPSRNDFYQPWLSNSHQITFYNFNLTGGQYSLYNQAIQDEKMIGKCFDEGLLYLVPNSVYSQGSCIGGIYQNPNDSVQMISASNSTGHGIRGFQLMPSGKRGFYKLKDYDFNPYPYPYPFGNYPHMVTIDMIIEH